MNHNLCTLVVISTLLLLCSSARTLTSYSGALHHTASALLGYWKLDDVSTHCQNVVDASDGQDGLSLGVSTGDWEVGLVDTLAIDGFSMRAATESPDGYVLLPNAPFDEAWSTGSWSLDFWVRMQALPSLLIESFGCGTVFTVDVSATGEISVTFGSTMAVSSTGAVSAGSWVYVTIDVTSEGVLIASVNGEKVGSAMLSSTMTSSGCSVAVGRHASVGTIFDEIAVHNGSSTQWYRHSLYSTGIALGCRFDPCFSGVSCTSSGASSYTCGQCPSGFIGNGEDCEIASPLEVSHSIGDCIPSTPADFLNVRYCPDHCRSRRACFLCGMYYTGLTMWDVRSACYNTSTTAVHTTNPSMPPSDTTSPLIPTTSLTRSAALAPSVAGTLSGTGTTSTCIEWVQLGEAIDGESAGDHSGSRISLNAKGNVVAIGASDNSGNGIRSGHVRVFELTTGTWIQKGADIDGDAAGDLAYVVAINAAGNTVVIGAPQSSEVETGSGRVRVYEYISGGWEQKGADIYGDGENVLLGEAVAINSVGDVIAFGSRFSDGNDDDSGRTRVYQYKRGSWVQMGFDIYGELSMDESGAAFALNGAGSVLVIGSFLSDGDWQNSGHVRVLEFNGFDWIQRGEDIDGNPLEQSGTAVSVNADGNVVAIGAVYNADNGPNSGQVRVYAYNGTDWVQKGQNINGHGSQEYFGTGVSINAVGDALVISALFEPGGAFGTDARVRAYEFHNGSWDQVGADVAGETPNDGFGYPSAMNGAGDIIATGSIGADGNGQDSGHVRMFQRIQIPCET